MVEEAGRVAAKPDWHDDPTGGCPHRYGGDGLERGRCRFGLSVQGSTRSARTRACCRKYRYE